MKSLKLIAIGAALFIGAAAVVPAGAVVAQSPAEQMQTGVDSIGGQDSPKADSMIKTAVNTFLFVIGAVAVFIIILGGFKYVTSNGDAAAVKSAKDTVLYAVIGLIVAITAYAIVNFVIDRSSPQPVPTTPPTRRDDGQIGPMP
jgi:hypothetical protein